MLHSHQHWVTWCDVTSEESQCYTVTVVTIETWILYQILFVTMWVYTSDFTPCNTLSLSVLWSTILSTIRCDSMWSLCWGRHISLLVHTVPILASCHPSCHQLSSAVTEARVYDRQDFTNNFNPFIHNN